MIKVFEWISVKKKLPKVHELVIVGYSDGIKKNEWVACGHLRPKKRWYNQFEDEYGTDPEIYPTHWMPLPKPPGK